MRSSERPQAAMFDTIGLTITRRIAADPEHDRAMYTQPVLLRMTGPNGFDASLGIYLVFGRPHRLQFTWRWIEAPIRAPVGGAESLVTFKQSADGEGTSHF